MGIKHLWTVLEPFSERKPLYELQGKTVAIDLSGWICEAQNITDYYVQPKMYLRNLYFRTCFLLLMGVNLVFVLEGEAPEMKYDTIAARNAIQFKGAKSKADKTKAGKDRTRFNGVLRTCEEMLRLMGLVCLKGKGEAESLCAYLNENQLVDGCISQDSDCFAYGAKVVYRNFSISQQGAHAGSGGAVDVYNINKVMESLDFGRNKMVAMALFCGSDYCDGVLGIGKEAVIKLFNTVSDKDILDRLRSWRTNVEMYDKWCKQLTNKNICTSCGHSGKVQVHNKAGCCSCETLSGCHASFKDKRIEMKNEVNIRSKAIVDPNFPDEKLIHEFLVHKENVSYLNLKWQQPDLCSFIKFTTKHLQWDCLYAFEKFLPILTRWQLIHFKSTGPLDPKRIKKVRNPKGIPSYEIIWIDRSDNYRDLISDEQLESVDPEKLWSTVEPQNLVSRAYPELVRTFELSKIKPKKRTRKPKNPIDDLGDMLANTSISEPVPKRKYTRRKPKKGNDCKTIDSYFKKAVLNNCVVNANKEEENDLDLSDIVQEIVNREPPNYIKNLGLQFTKNLNESSFFISEATEIDLFEESMKMSESDEEEPDDSFSEEYVPLLTRLKKKS